MRYFKYESAENNIANIYVFSIHVQQMLKFLIFDSDLFISKILPLPNSIYVLPSTDTTIVLELICIYPMREFMYFFYCGKRHIT